MSLPRIVFMGTPEFGVPLLRVLAATNVAEVVGVFTQPPRPQGRGYEVTESPVHTCSRELGLAVFCPLSFNKEPEAIQQLRDWAPDWVIVAAYGLILPQVVLDIPRFACLNAHASLLPRWRGASPIQRALLAGESQTGISIMRMTAGMDEGPVIAQHALPIEEDDTTASLHRKLGELAKTAMLEVLTSYPDGNFPETVQSELPGEVTYAPKITKADGVVNWHNSAIQIIRMLKAFREWPGCWAEISLTGGVGLRIKLLEVEIAMLTAEAAPGKCGRQGDQSEALVIACGDGTWLRVLSLQPENSRIMSGRDFLSGYGSKLPVII